MASQEAVIFPSDPEDLIHVEDANEFVDFGFFFQPLKSSLTETPLTDE